MHICIFRRRFTPWGVDGTMVIMASFSADTLERPNRHLQADAYKMSLVPLPSTRRCRSKEEK